MGAEDVKAKAEEVKAAEKKAVDIKKANELEDVSKKLKAKAEPLVKAAEENGATEEAKKASDEAVMEWHTAQDKLKDFMDGSSLLEDADEAGEEDQVEEGEEGEDEEDEEGEDEDNEEDEEE